MCTLLAVQTETSLRRFSQRDIAVCQVSVFLCQRRGGKATAAFEERRGYPTCSPKAGLGRAADC